MNVSNKQIQKFIGVVFLCCIMLFIDCSTNKKRMSMKERKAKYAKTGMEERNILISKAINTINQGKIIEGIKVLGVYPTREGLDKLIEIWENHASVEIEREVLWALLAYEEYYRSRLLIEKMFLKHYSVEMSEKKKKKLIRFISNSPHKKSKKLLDKIK